MSTISLSSPVMSDKTLLLSVEDLISIAMGPHDRNTVNFKMIQTVLHILARQMRVLEQKVVVVAGELPEKRRTSSRLDGRDDELYRRRTPPEFETEAERIAWEKEEDERLQLMRQRTGDEGRGGSGSARGGRESSDVSGQRRSRIKSRAGRERDDDDKGGRGRSGGRGGQGRDDDDKGGRGRVDGRGRSGSRGGQGRDDADLEGRDGARGRGGQGRNEDDLGGSGRSGGRGGQGRDDDDRGGRGRSGGRGQGYDDDERGGRGRSGGRGGHDDDDREGRGRSGGRGGHDRYDDDDERGGRGRAGARGGRAEDDERGGRGGAGGRGGRAEDDERGGRGGAGGRGGRAEDDERGGRGGAGGRGGRAGDDERGDRGGAGGRGRYDDDDREGRGRSGGRGGHDGYDDDDIEGRGRSGGRGGREGLDEDDARGGRGGPGGHGGRDDDDERGGRGRVGGRGYDRDDDERGGRGVSGRRDDDEGGRGGTGGRGGDDDGEGGGRGGHGGYDRDDDGRGGHDRVGGRGGHDMYDDDKREGRDRAGRRDHDEERGHAAGGLGRGGERGGFDEDKGRGRGGHGKGGGYDERGGPLGRDEAGIQGIGVREVGGPGKEKLLVVEKGPTTVGRSRDRDSIAVVTQSQFQLLEDQVDELWRAAGPLPELKMPDNKRLREDLAAGASLTDAMQAMQVSARVQAAEQAITKLGGLLTQLAASGALPADAADAVMAGGWMDDDEAMQKSTSTGTAYKSIRVDPSPKGGIPGPGPRAGRPSGLPQASSKSSVSLAAYITKPEMGTALVKLRDEVTKTLHIQIERAAAAAETAEKTAHAVGEKVEELLKMDSRLNSMYSLVEDYSEQLAGFDAGLNTQMASFKEQMTTMRAELEEGLQQLDTSNSNPETAAVMELNERFEGLVRGLDDTLLQHTALNNTQVQLTQELKTLMEGVEMLREQKADRDELLDILRDKADVTMLEGLVRQAEFDRAQADLEQRLEKCNNKFQKQDDVWMTAMMDLKELADSKAQNTELSKLRDEATTQLRAIDNRIDQLSLILGEPKAALLMRKLARDAVCGACLAPALMEPGAEPAPPRLPAARGPQAPPRAPEPKAPDYPDFRTHRCHRWVGGSHTLLPAARTHATPLDLPDVTRKYTGYGDDGRMYWLEAEMEPCVECNPAPSPAPAPPTTARTDIGTGAGDTCEC